jgi:hypothetical protein
MNTLLIRFIPFLLLLGSCNSNPYPVEGGEIVNGKAPVKNDVTPAYSIDIEDTLRFKEGVLTKHKVKFFVPNGDNSV